MGTTGKSGNSSAELLSDSTCLLYTSRHAGGPRRLGPVARTDAGGSHRRRRRPGYLLRRQTAGRAAGRPAGGAQGSDCKNQEEPAQALLTRRQADAGLARSLAGALSRSRPPAPARHRGAPVDATRGRNPQRLRELVLATTELAKATAATIRVRLLKIGAAVIRNTRRIRILLASHHPLRDTYFIAANALASP